MSSVGPTSPDQPADLPSFQRSDARRRRVVQGSVCLAFVASATWTLLACKRAGNGSITIRQAAATLAWVRGHEILSPGAQPDGELPFPLGYSY